MREPIYTGDTDANEENFRTWAYENKRRADRLLAAAQVVLRFHATHLFGELRAAATDYEDKIG